MIKGEWGRGDCDSNTCVEVMPLQTSVKVRDSKDPNGPWLAFTPGEWSTFVAAVKGGRFDL